MPVWKAGPVPGLERVPRTLLERHPAEVAPDLLGCVITSDLGGTRVGIRITEVEAYSGTADPGSHAFRGQTARNAVMFGPAGHLYVYFTYGMHYCANVVCGFAGSASGLLLRAGEVVEGVETARRRRFGPSGEPPPDRDLARGPARLASALGIRREHGGSDLLGSVGPLGLFRAADGDAPPPAVAASFAQGRPPAVASGPRVGVRGPGGDGEAFPWRFWIAGNPTVSPYRAAAPLRPRPPKRPPV